jgi:uncharacterized protein (DUF2235 family)
MSKNILLFMDGTRNKPSDKRQLKDTNVWKLYEAASASLGGRETYARYIRGVGTEREEDVESPADDLRLFRLREWNPPAHPAKRVVRLVRRVPRRLALKYGASAVGWGISDRIRDAYGFLCRHYESGDHVYLFGFSRGAFEARSLAGFVDSVGLLLRSQAVGPDARRLVDMAYEIYRRGDEESLMFLRRFLRRMTRLAAPGPATDFRKSTEVRLHFVGVWDTVEATGIGELKLGPLTLENKHLPFVGRHTSYHLARSLPLNVRHGRHALAIHELRTRFEPLLWDAPFRGQEVSQVWFAGAHADVGGGYPDTRLSDIALNWLADEATLTSAKTAAPLVFSGIPRAVAPKGPLLPHHAIQGDFFWATPAPRAPMVCSTALSPEVTATFSVHASAVDRLFDGAATTYEAYPFEKDYGWTRYFPKGTHYPQGVAGVLSLLDDLSVRLHVSRAVADDARVVRDKASPSVSTSSPAAGPAAWRRVQDVSELRLAERYVSQRRAGFGRSGVNVDDLCDALALLLAFERVPTVDRFVHVMTERACKLTRVADLSTEFGLEIRSRWLPRFDDVCQAARLAEASCPAQVMSAATRIRSDLCTARNDLQAELPYTAPAAAKIKKRAPPLPPPA